MKPAELKQKLHDYIEIAEEKKLKAIYTIMEDDIENYNYQNDEAFVAELNRRTDDLESGRVKGLSWDEVKIKAMKVIKSK